MQLDVKNTYKTEQKYKHFAYIEWDEMSGTDNAMRCDARQNNPLHVNMANKQNTSA